MPVIRLITHINAPVAIVFDLARSIDLHKISTHIQMKRLLQAKHPDLLAWMKVLPGKQIILGLAKP